MSATGEIAHEAVKLIVSGDAQTYQAIATSLSVSIFATLIASLIGLPIGLVIGIAEFRGKSIVILFLNTLLSMPTVVVGLSVYIMLCGRGPLGGYSLLFTKTAIVIGEVLLILPLVVAFSAAAVNGVPREIRDAAFSLGASWWQMARTVLEEARFAVLAAVIAGFGRAVSEVGAALMLGGNIAGYTRTMTTAIALETSKGEFALGLALGVILLALAFSVNLLFHYFQQRGRAAA